MSEKELKTLENKINKELKAAGLKSGDIWYTNDNYRDIVFRNLGIEDPLKVENDFNEYRGFMAALGKDTEKMTVEDYKEDLIGEYKRKIAPCDIHELDDHEERGLQNG